MLTRRLLGPLRTGFVAPSLSVNAWVSFTSAGVALDSENVSSITDNSGAGDWTVTFLRPMGSANYAVEGGTLYNAAAGGANLTIDDSAAPTATSLRVETRDQNSDALVDCDLNHLAVIGR